VLEAECNVYREHAEQALPEKLREMFEAKIAADKENADRTAASHMQVGQVCVCVDGGGTCRWGRCVCECVCACVCVKSPETSGRSRNSPIINYNLAVA